MSLLNRLNLLTSSSSLVILTSFVKTIISFYVITNSSTSERFNWRGSFRLHNVCKQRYIQVQKIDLRNKKYTTTSLTWMRVSRKTSCDGLANKKANLVISMLTIVLFIFTAHTIWLPIVSLFTTFVSIAEMYLRLNLQIITSLLLTVLCNFDLSKSWMLIESLGFEPRVTWWKVHRDPLDYVSPIFI